MNLQPVISYFSELLINFQEINRIFSSSITESDSDNIPTQVFKQEFLYQFINRYEEPKEFRTNLLSLLTTDSEEKVKKVILVPLLELLQKTISQYEESKTIFENYLPSKLSSPISTYYKEKIEALKNDLEQIKTYPYPTEQERTLLMEECRKELGELYEQEAKERKRTIPLCKNFFPEIYLLAKSFSDSIRTHMAESIQPEESIVELVSSPSKSELEQFPVEPDMVFHNKMYEKFLILEKKLIADSFLSEKLSWIRVHKNKQPDIKSLVVFLAGLLENGYFLPNRDSKIKSFFEARYNISIGQNFERRRRNSLTDAYKVIFYDYPF